MRRRKIIIGGLVVVLLATIGLFFKVVHDNPKTEAKTEVPTSQSKKAADKTATTTTSSSAKEKAPYALSEVPTLFIHGYGGTAGSFGGMLNRLEKISAGSLQMTLTVSGDGQGSQVGSLDNRNPLIQVLFSDNTNNEWNQAQWLANCLTLLKNQGVASVNLVGHSMGGVDVVRYLFSTAQDASVPQINKIITIGAPFNEFELLNEDETLDSTLSSGPQNKSERYTEFSADLAKITPTLPWLNIGGLLVADDPDQGDGTVPLPSAFALTSLATQLKFDYRNQIIMGDNAAHSNLHENTEVDKAVANFLWGN